MTGNADTGEMEDRGFWLRGEHVPLLVLAGGVVIVASLLTPAVWPVVLIDGAYVAAVILAAAGWGAWPVAWLGLGRRPFGQQFCLAIALGLGVLSTVTLVLGVGGLLNAVVAWGLLGVGGVLGLVRVYLTQAGSGRAPDAGGEGPSLALRARTGWPAGAPAATGPSGESAVTRLGVGLRSLALLPVCLPLAIVLFGATLPPGVLSNEARGYDVLEYHLQVPREHFETCRIQFLPHNVYASFPQQVETLYLLLMYLTDDPLRAAIPAQLLHASLGVLMVVALVCWSMPGWPRILVALVAGCVPWLVQLGCLAYVELGMLFFAAVAGGLVVDHLRRDATCDWRSALAAGLCAGLAGGCKYTGVALVSAALGAAWLVTMHSGPRRRLGRLALFGVGALAALSPWLIRNAAFTGNPVYPFAYKWFGGSASSAEQDAQWARGHRLPEDSDSIAGRARMIGDELYCSSMYGPALWVLAAVGFALRPSRRNWLAVVWFALIMFVWATCTHMPGRFALPLVVPLTLLAGTSVALSNAETGPTWLSRTRRLAVGPIVLAAAGGCCGTGPRSWTCSETRGNPGTGSRAIGSPKSSE